MREGLMTGSMRVARWLPLLLLVVAGGAAYALQADCSLPNIVSLPGGVCVQILQPTAERNQEASLAPHPTDPDTLLLTWRVGEFVTGPRIYAAVTTDGAKTWNIRH